MKPNPFRCSPGSDPMFKSHIPPKHNATSSMQNSTQYRIETTVLQI